MPIMATQAQNDARGAARLLAKSALSCFEDTAGGAPKDVTLNNVYRLLEAYRAEAFFDMGASARDCSFTNSDLSVGVPSDTHVLEVRDAIDKAKNAVFADIDRDEALKKIKNVIGSIAYPESFDKPDDIDRGKAQEFFRNIVLNLNYGCT